jgi:hypothetical protein
MEVLLLCLDSSFVITGRKQLPPDGAPGPAVVGFSLKLSAALHGGLHVLSCLRK